MVFALSDELENKISGDKCWVRSRGSVIEMPRKGLTIVSSF